MYAPKHIFVIDADIKKVQAMKCIAAAEGNTQEKAEVMCRNFYIWYSNEIIRNAILMLGMSIFIVSFWSFSSLSEGCSEFPDA